MWHRASKEQEVVVPEVTETRIDIERPYWDQSTYSGRAKHFFAVTNPLNIFASSKDLEHAKEVVSKYRQGESLLSLGITEEELWRSKYLYDSAYHPDTGEKLVIIGRMSAQMPMNTIITGCMLQFYQSTQAVIFWQWVNQSFNATVNYSNRSGSNPIPASTLIQSYVAATSGAVLTALTLNRLARKGPPLFGRLVPLAAVAAANCVNLPCMRMTELQNGIELQNDEGVVVGHSKSAARWAISSVVFSRILMASPSMILSPVVMDYIDKRQLLCGRTWASTPIQILLCGVILIFSTPLCCAIFPQRVAISVDSLDQEARREVLKSDPALKTVYYNKGL